jgi:hypothetical protein
MVHWVVFQVGANVGESISIDLSSSMKNESIGGISVAGTFKLTDIGIAKDGADTVYADGNLTIGGTAIAAPAIIKLPAL